MHEEIPERSPFKLGDRVQMHGYPGSHTLQRRVGFRGEVRGYVGAGWLLGGVTDDGVPWTESWARLVADGEPDLAASVICCTCCPCEHDHPNYFGPGNGRPAGDSGWREM